VLQEKFNVGVLRAVHRMFATIAKPSNRNAQEAWFRGTTIKDGTKKYIFITFLIQPTK
jgi:hypothetical protein